jgi:excisionase family DNA binding protein
MTKNSISFNELPEYVQQIHERLEILCAHILEEKVSGRSKLLSIDDAAKMLRLSKHTIYRKTCKGEIPYCRKPGTRRLWFIEETLIEWLRNQSL